KEIEEQEKEFYSKLQAAKSIKFVIGEKSNEFIGLNRLKLTNNEKFSRDLATILARKKEVVAVNLTTHLDSCIINISKNSNWLQEGYQYINKIKECLIKISKYEPMSWEEAFTKHDTKVLITSVIKYCSGRFESRLKKLKDDTKNSKNDQYIKSFLEYASKSVNINDGKANPLIKSQPVVTHQPIFSWKNIIQPLIPSSMMYVDFMNACLSNKIKADKIATIYGDIAFKSNFLSYALKELDRTIQEGVDNISGSLLWLESDSDESSMNSDQIMFDDSEHVARVQTALQGAFEFNM
ncbi:11920_t:CDS:2, partial [Funneliformis geosporum]